MKLSYITVLIYYSLLESVFGFEMKLSMPGVVPDHDDAYLCASFRIPESDKDSFIKSYEPTTDSSIAHHILLFGCQKPFSTESYYSCGNICQNDTEKNILFAWANNAEKFVYSNDVGMPVGRSTGIMYIVLQVHYLKKRTIKDYGGMILQLTYERPIHLINIILLSVNEGRIPLNTSHSKLDVACIYNGGENASIWAFRAHCHSICYSLSGFRALNSSGRVDLIGKGNAKMPETFYRPNSSLEIMPGDILLLRCLYDLKNRNHTTIIGNSHHDEMCRFYFMIMRKSNENLGNISCSNGTFEHLWKKVSNYSLEYGDADPDEDLSFSNMNIKPLKVNLNWKVKDTLGEVTSLAILPKSQSHQNYSLLLLHLDNRHWTQNSFIENVYFENKTEIQLATIFEVDPITGRVLRKGGANNFVLPHGITVTKDGKYIWVTDVALHQVMRFRLQNNDKHKLMDDKPDMIFGERFVPGKDKSHFCKPSKVAVDSKGLIFVADGNCNSRVVVFHANGTYSKMFTAKELKMAVNSITIEEDRYGDLKKYIIWIADREHKRIMGFNYDGNVIYTSPSTIFGMIIYAITLNQWNRLFYGVMSSRTNEGTSFTFDSKTNELKDSWNLDYSFKVPNELCIAENGTVIFVAELKKVVKFSLNEEFLGGINILTEGYTPLHEFVSSLGSKFIGIIVFITILLILLSLLLFQIIIRYRRTERSIKRYGPRYIRKDGFEPLTDIENLPIHKSETRGKLET